MRGRTAAAVDKDPLGGVDLLRGRDEAEAGGVEERLHGGPESVRAVSRSQREHGGGEGHDGDSRAAEGGGLLVRERALRDDPGELGGRADVLGVGATVDEGAALDEAGDVVADGGGCDVLAGLHDVAGEVAAEDGAGSRDVVDDCAR